MSEILDYPCEAGDLEVAQQHYYDVQKYAGRLVSSSGDSLPFTEQQQHYNEIVAAQMSGESAQSYRGYGVDAVTD